MLKTIHHFSQNSFVEKVKKSKEEENSEVNLGQQMPKCRLYYYVCFCQQKLKKIYFAKKN